VVRKSSPLGRSRRRRPAPGRQSAASAAGGTGPAESGEDTEKLIVADPSGSDPADAAEPEAGADAKVADTTGNAENAENAENAATGGEHAQSSPADGESDDADGPAGSAAADSDGAADSAADDTVVIDADRPAAVSYRERRRSRGTASRAAATTSAAGTDAGSPADDPATGTREAGKKRRIGRKRAGKPRAGTSGRGPAKSGPARSAPAGERTRLLTAITAAAGVVIVVGCIVASVVFTVKYDELRDQRQQRNDYATFAKQVVVEMTTLNPDNADDIYKLSQERTTGRAQQMFRDNMKMVAEMIRQGNAKTATTVLSDAVTESTDKEGQVIMVFGWVGATTDPKDEPIYQTFRWKVDITKINGQMKVSNMEFVI